MRIDYRTSRPVTTELLEYADDGILTWETLARAALEWLSESEVRAMAEANGLVDEDEDEEEAMDPMDDFNYPGSHYHY